MTIKQQGGIFGRNPSFNDVEANQGTFADLASTTSMVSGGINKTVGSYGNTHIRSDSNAAAYNGGNLSFGGKSVATGNQYIFGGLKFMSDPASGTGWDTYASLYLTNADSSVSEKVFFKNNGSINPVGNIVVNSGNGIDFSATSGTGTSELFDDYEEGTWTPALSAYAGTPTTQGSYVKVGRLVKAGFKVILDGTADTSNFRITGLPFSFGADGGPDYGDGAVITYINSGTADIRFLCVGTSDIMAYNSSGTILSYNTVGTSTEVRGVVVYTAA